MSHVRGGAGKLEEPGLGTGLIGLYGGDNIVLPQYNDDEGCTDTGAMTVEETYGVQWWTEGLGERIEDYIDDDEVQVMMMENIDGEKEKIKLQVVLVGGEECLPE